MFLVGLCFQTHQTPVVYSELLIIMPLPPKCWNYCNTTLYLTYVILTVETSILYTLGGYFNKDVHQNTISGLTKCGVFERHGDTLTIATELRFMPLPF